MRTWLAGAAVLTALAGGCTAAPETAQEVLATELQANAASTRAEGARGQTFPEAPRAPVGPLPEPVDTALADLQAAAVEWRLDRDALAEVVAGGDVRAAWFLSDLLRFAPSREDADDLAAAFRELTGVEDLPEEGSWWRAVTDHLIAWDLPAWDGYADRKASVYLAIEPGWQPFFDDPAATLDWRLVSWGGVRIDDRPLGLASPCPQGCIPALDDPATTDAAGGSWYDDDAIVFGVVVGEEAVALPRHQMEVHELVNLTLGGERLGIPYCTLCGAAQAFRTGRPGGDLVLRTSGLLFRSNKVMYDRTTGSAFDTFRGVAVTGPLRDEGVVLEQVTVSTTTWGTWRAAHPETRILARDGGIGRVYPENPLGGRDDAGPIFPVGAVDPRLPVSEPVLGVVLDDRALAFPVADATAALAAGREVRLDEVALHLVDGVLEARAGADELPAHEARWFAWSQFHPSTLVWTPLGG